MIIRINELTTLLKHITCDCKLEFDGRKRNSSQKWNKDLCRCECKNPVKHCVCKKIIFGILVHVSVKIIEY